MADGGKLQQFLNVSDSTEDNPVDWKRKASQINFVARNFSYKECASYVEENPLYEYLPWRCRCGLFWGQHNENAREAKRDKWSMDHIVTQNPTNICGAFTFEDGQEIKYLRLADSDDPADLAYVMSTPWKMRTSATHTLVLSLIITHLDAVPDYVQQGLAESVLVNNCWIISSGYGEMERLQEVAQQRLGSAHAESSFSSVYMAPWKNDLLDMWQFPESRNMEAFKKYTHCIFVDNGEHRPSSMSATREFRHRLEEFIRKEIGFPIIRILIGGERTDLVQILMGLNMGWPLLVCAGTDGLAEILAEALDYIAETERFEDFTNTQEARLRVLLNNEDSKQDSNNVDWSYTLLLKIVKHEQLITVFHEDSDESLDKKIFETVAKSKDQRGLQLLIRWAFIKGWPSLMDYLEKDIWMNFVLDLILEDPCMCDCTDNTEILQHCLQKGLGADVLQKRRPYDCTIQSTLLNSVSATMVSGRFISFLTQIADMETRPLQMQSSLKILVAQASQAEQQIQIRKDEAMNTMHQYYTFRKNCRMDSSAESDVIMQYWNIWEGLVRKWKLVEEAQQDYMKLKSEVDQICEQWLVLPAIWAIIFERCEVAQLFWKRCKDPVNAGLIISRACSKLLQILPQYDTDNLETIREEGKKFETFAVLLIERYNSKDPTKAVELIQLNPNYLRGQLDCSLFICSLPIQHIVEHEWWNDFNANALVIIISFFCPFLVATRLFSFAPVAVEAQSAFLPSSSTPSVKKRKSRNPTCPEKLKKFYSAPITKFYTHALFYVAFVFLYAYALTVGLRADYVSIFEILIVVELISFLTETVVEVIPMLEDSCHYASFVHNVIELPAFYKYDLILNALNVVAILCGLGRLVPFEVIKSLYAVSFLLHSFRFFKFYYFYSNLGPKLAMIERMLGEMMEFLAFLLVFLLATGVAMEALLYISRTHFKLAVLQDIFTIQFYRIFGDNNLELAEGKKDGCNVPDGIDCPVSNPLVPRLLDLFMLIVVTLLMNLLIAIFSNVYEQFESESRELWKRARCHLLFEFKSKSIHPMPFNIIERFIQLSIATFRLCQRTYRKWAARHKNVKVAEQTTLTPTEPLPDEQADLIQKRLEEAVRKSQEDRMDTYLKTIRQKALPRLLQIMETCAEDTATNMVESLTCRVDAGFKDISQMSSNLHSEMMEMKRYFGTRFEQVMERLEESANLPQNTDTK